MYDLHIPCSVHDVHILPESTDFYLEPMPKDFQIKPTQHVPPTPPPSQYLSFVATLAIYTQQIDLLNKMFIFLSPTKGFLPNIVSCVGRPYFR